MISLKVGTIGFHGIKMVDTYGEYAVDEIWCKDKSGWITKEIPEGDEIIGFKCDHYLRRLGFVFHKPEKF